MLTVINFFVTTLIKGEGDILGLFQIFATYYVYDCSKQTVSGVHIQHGVSPGVNESVLEWRLSREVEIFQLPIIIDLRVDLEVHNAVCIALIR